MTRLFLTCRPAAKTLAYAAGVAAGAAVLAACGHSAPTRFFTLDPAPPAAPAVAGYAGPPVKVLSVNIPPALDREELVSEGPAGEVQVHDFEHWAAPLGQTARQTLVQDLAARLPTGRVLGPGTPGGEGVATLSADVVAFQAGPAGATLQADWSLTLPGGAAGPLVWRAPIRAYQAPGAGGGEGPATAAAMSALLGQLADQIAAVLPAEAAALQARQAEALARTQAAARPAAVRTVTQTRTVQQQSRTTPGA
jgi:uncharacterized protein